jgi:MFS family permease
MTARSIRPVLVLCAAQFVDVLGVTELISALARALAQLGASPAAAGPTVTAYAMCFGGLLMLGARLGARCGDRIVLSVGLATFAAGSMLAALAPVVAVLVAARCLQGAAAAISVPAALSLLLAVCRDRRSRDRAMSAWSAAGGVAGAAGFVLGGVVTELAGWRAVFWCNVPLAAAVWIGVMTTPALGGGPRRARARRLDLSGAALLTLSAMSLVLGASLLPSASSRVLAVALTGGGVVLGIGFVAAERRAADPLLPPGALRAVNLRTGTVASFMNTATTSSAAAIATLELQRQQHLAAAAAALRLIPLSLGAIAGAALAGRLHATRTHRVVLVRGLRTIACGNALLLATPAAAWVLPAGVALAGLGIGLSSAAATRIGTDVRPQLRDAATGVLNTAAQLGTAIGTAALLCLAEATAGSALPISGARLAWVVAAAMALAGATSIRGSRAGLRSLSPASRRS